MTVTRSAGEVLVDALRIHGVNTVFGVPGESFLPALDALHGAADTIRFVTCRHEAGAGHMAEAHGKLSGAPGVCIVTRAPGALQASVAVQTAKEDSTPMILLVGLVGRASAGREAWQELDIEAVFGRIAKWAARVDRAERLPELVSRAFHVATSGRPGPVVLGLPEDLLFEPVEVEDTGRYRPVQVAPAEPDLQRLRSLLTQARRPFLLLGGGGWSAAACDAIREFAERHDLPVGTGFRRQDLFDNRHPNYVGDVGVGVAPTLAARVRECDLLIAVGGRLGETTTSDFTLVRPPCPAQRLVHVHADSAELGRVYQAALAIQAGMREFAEAACALEPVDASAWRAWTQAARDDYATTLVPGPMPGALDLGRVMTQLSERLPSDAIVTNGAGNYTGWLHRFHRYRGFRTQLAPASGVMGYGLPAAIAAKLRHPQRTVVCVAGDGCFLMSVPELATLQQQRLAVVILVVNNGQYGSIRMHQEKHYPGRVVGTALDNPDFAALARAHGLHGTTVQETAAFGAALEEALASDRSTLIELRTDPAVMTTRLTLDALRRGKPPRPA